MELVDLQNKLYCLLEEICKTFKELDVDYCLAYGTLLGAKRHQGIIPWDDDIDLFVPRPHYMKLLSLYNSTSQKSFLYSIETCQEYHLPFAKIALAGTRSKEAQPNWPRSMGVSIDIFPLDGLPSGKFSLEFHFYKMKLVNRCIGTYHFSFGALSSVKAKVLWIIAHCLGYKRLYNTSINLCEKYSFDESVICGNLVWGSYHHNDLFRRSLLGKYKEMYFKNLKLPVPEYTEALLEQWYGDYMRIPSKEEIEKWSHNFADMYETDSI